MPAQGASSLLEHVALALALLSPLAMLALLPDGPALLLLLAAAAVPAAAVYGLYRLALRGRPPRPRRPVLVPPPLPPAPAEIRAAPFRVTRRGEVVLAGTLDDVVRAARAGAVEAFDVVAGGGVEVAPADLADLVPFVPSRAEARARRAYLVYLAAGLAAGAAGTATYAGLRLAGAGIDERAPLAVVALAVALVPILLLRRDWRRLAAARAQGLVPESAAAARAALLAARQAYEGSGLGQVAATPAPATRSVLLLVVAVSALAMFLPPEVLQLRLAKENDAIRAGELWRLVTAGLVHGGAIHLFMNAWVLSDLGGLVERLLGSRRMLVVLWGGVVTGSLASFATNPQRSVGISGGLFALVGALLVVGLRHRRTLPPVARRMLVRAPVEIIVLNVALGMALPFIDNAAHLGGLAGGFLLGLGATLRPPMAAALRGAAPRGSGPSAPPGGPGGGRAA